MVDRHKPETKKRLQKEYRERNRELLRQKGKARRLSYRYTVFAHYGERCVTCGFDDLRALQLDHIDDNGAEHRKSLGGQKVAGYQFYKWVIDNGFPDDLQTLCANCNNIKQWEINNPS